MNAPERIWVDIAEEYTRGAMIGNVYATDIGDEPYIHFDAHEAAVAAARAEAAQLQDVLDAIYVYANDTLSGRTDGPDDREWQRAGIVEIRNRARALSTIRSAVDTRERLAAEASK